MGHLSVAAHDYLLTGQHGRYAAGQGKEGVGAGHISCRPRDLWQVSAACFPDRSSRLEFIWVTATGVVCCDKRLMGKAAWGAASGGVLGSCWLGSGVCWGEELGWTPLRCPTVVPHWAAPVLTLSSSILVWGRHKGCLLSWHSLLKSLHPSTASLSRCPPSSFLAIAQGMQNISRKGSSLGTPLPTRKAGPDPWHIGPAVPQLRLRRKNVPFCSILLTHVPV